MILNALTYTLLGISLATAIHWNPETRQIPAYIIEHAPVVYLYSEERYFPGSIEDYLKHVVISNGVQNYTASLTPANLARSAEKARKVFGDESHNLYLTALEQWEPEPGPDWLTKYKTNQPNVWNGKINDAIATLVVVDKPDLDVVDAFWHYFYPFNMGPFVMGHGPFGNHLGDWEHSLVRFNRTTLTPSLVWMSAHGGGTAYTWDSLLESDIFNGSRPIIFSARGTHAQYTSPGRHPHDIPWHMLSDYTDRGALWDPSQNYVAYTFNGEEIHPGNGSELNREAKFGAWLLFDGKWGNKQLSKTDARQQWSPFEWRLIDGPTGPLFKNPLRNSPCERFKWWNYFKSCRVRRRITPGEGFEADASGCEAIVDRFPQAAQPFIKILIKGGWFCFWLDRLFS